MYVSDDDLLDDQPPLPYFPGFEVDIWHHVPPEPITNKGMNATDNPFFDARTRFQAILDRPPGEASCQPAQLERPESLRLRITSILRCGPIDGAQVVICDVESQARPKFRAVAKIYDALHYPFFNVGDDASDCPYYQRDVMIQADGDYSYEAASYVALQSGDQTEGKCTPTYHGSWTFSINVDCPSRPVVVTRDVRLILIEHLQGCTIQDLQEAAWKKKKRIRDIYPEDYRLLFCKTFLEAKDRVWTTGVKHEDLAPRNVMISPVPSEGKPLTEQPLPRVTIFDFGQSYIRAEARDKDKKLPLSPIMSWWDNGGGMWFDERIPL